MTPRSFGWRHKRNNAPYEDEECQLACIIASSRWTASARRPISAHRSAACHRASHQHTPRRRSGNHCCAAFIRRDSAKVERAGRPWFMVAKRRSRWKDCSRCSIHVASSASTQARNFLLSLSLERLELQIRQIDAASGSSAASTANLTPCRTQLQRESQHQRVDASDPDTPQPSQVDSRRFWLRAHANQGEETFLGRRPPDTASRSHMRFWSANGAMLALTIVASAF